MAGASEGENDVASSGLDQSTNHHGNTYGKDNDNSQSYETPWWGGAIILSFGDTISTATIPQSYALPSPGK